MIDIDLHCVRTASGELQETLEVQGGQNAQGTTWDPLACLLDFLCLLARELTLRTVFPANAEGRDFEQWFCFHGLPNWTPKIYTSQYSLHTFT